ncbi:MAG: hypothetical protein II968_07545 [Selenomonadaceae bacterium]|nr:hypothetical protein [Selenomonadaceae bacterium]
MAITKAEVKRIVLGALEYYKELMDAANAKKFPTKEELQTEIDAIDVPNLSEVESRLGTLESGVEGLQVLQANATIDIADLKSDVAELKDDPNTEVEDITYADVASLFDA